MAGVTVRRTRERLHHMELNLDQPQTESIRQERVEYFRTPRDAESARPNLDRNVALPKDVLIKAPIITGIYSYEPADWVICQLEIDGNICRQEHGKGWIMRLPGGAEGYVGQHCAKEHFGADHAFAKEAARARREVGRDDLVGRLRALLDDPVRRERIVDAFERQQALKAEISRVRDMLPFAVKNRLHDMTKTGKSSVSLEFEYLENDEDREGNVIEVRKWRIDFIGAIGAPNALDTLRTDALGERLRAALTAFDQAKPSSDHSDKELRVWAEYLEGVDRSESEINEFVEELGKFKQPQSLNLLCWLCRIEQEQVAVTRAALQLTGRKAVTDGTARSTFNGWRRELITSRNALRLRVP
jgi:hypothetical protein